MLNSPKRNPLLTIEGKTVQTVGDLHLGRVYSNGVPLHMRGMMEKRQREEFEKFMDDGSPDYLVLMGDTFDAFVVDPTTVDYVARTILASAREFPSRTIVLLGGNHDESKDLTLKSSFDNLKLTLREAKLDNLLVVEEPTQLDGMGFISWSAKYSAKELAEKLTGKYDAVFCHCDVVLPSNANFYNMVPTSTLAKITKKVVTGHVHRPDVIERDGIEVVLTGSIIPLAHGEELDSDKLFYTLTRTQYDADPDKYKNTFVRFALQEGEELPEGDFLQVKAYTIPTKNDDTDSEPDTENFDLKKVLTNFLTEQELPDERVAEVVERFVDRNVE